MDGPRLAVIGCGPMGGDLARNAARIAGVDVVATTDVDRNAARKLAGELGSETTADADELLSRDDVDAVIVATPGFTHRDIVVSAFEAGKHVFCEKPMALDPADCLAMIDAGKKAGKKLMIGQVLRYVHAFAYTSDLVRQGKLGDVVYARITRTCNGWGQNIRDWRKMRAKSGGVLFEFSVHELDFMMHVAGDIRQVHALANRTSAEDIDYPDTLVLNLSFASGAIGQLTAGLADPIGMYGGEIVGTEGAVQFDAGRSELVSRIGSRKPKVIKFDQLDLEPPVARELREFVESVRDDLPVTIPGEDGMRVVAVAYAAYRSVDQGRCVDVLAASSDRSLVR
jgi:predicted dehydrogenase